MGPENRYGTAEYLPDEESHLFLAWRDGDNRAIETLYRKMRVALFRLLTTMANDPGVAEEVYQEAWITIIRNADRYEPRARFRTFFMTIARSRLLDAQRRIGRTVKTAPLEEEVFDIADVDTPTPEMVAISKDMVARFEIALRALPDVQREVFVLKEREDYSWQDIATIIGAPLETARARHRYALKKLTVAIGVI
ncbi:MAG: hypothetical protein RL490_2138 [Pseudomonadota bacterium]